MLAITFSVGGESYALDGRDVVEIVPLVPVKRLPLAPPWVRGLMHYRGHIVPVVDLCELGGGAPASELLSTRVVVVSFNDLENRTRLVGLVAERLTDTVTLADDSVRTSGIRVQQAPFLGGVVADQGRMTQLIRVSELVPAPLQAMLYGEEQPA